MYTLTYRTDEFSMAHYVRMIEEERLDPFQVVFEFVHARNMEAIALEEDADRRREVEMAALEIELDIAGAQGPFSLRVPWGIVTLNQG